MVLAIRQLRDDELEYVESDIPAVVRAAGRPVNATGGIRFVEDAVALLEAGASRLGASRTEAVVASRIDRLKVVSPASSSSRKPARAASQASIPRRVHVPFTSI
jgi:deoxyribose-phosphate aldolase